MMAPVTCVLQLKFSWHSTVSATKSSSSVFDILIWPKLTGNVNLITGPAVSKGSIRTTMSRAITRDIKQTVKLSLGRIFRRTHPCDPKNPWKNQTQANTLSCLIAPACSIFCIQRMPAIQSDILGDTVEVITSKRQRIKSILYWAWRCTRRY